MTIPASSDRQPYTTNRLILITLIWAALIIVACAGTSKKKPFKEYEPLIRSGFELRQADTPEKQSVLQSLPLQTVVPYTINEKVHYVYVPANCQCAYVGTPENYKRLRQDMPADQSASYRKIGFSSNLYFYSPGIGSSSFLERH